MGSLVLVLSFLVYSSGFLLNDRTQPPTTNNPDKQIDLVMDLVINERTARRKQDHLIAQLQNELLTTQQAITNNYNNRNRNSSIDEKRYMELENKTNMLQNENAELKKNYSSLLQRSQQQEDSYTDLKNEFNRLEQEVLSLRQLKTVSDLQTVYEVWNDTKHLETEIQKTNNLLSSVVNDGNARKQDFLALFEKTDKIERGIKNKVALTASPVEKTYDSGQIIQFSDIKLTNGINSTSSLKEHGFFTCEKSGLYLISVYITTNTNHGRYYVYINDLRVGDSFGSKNDFYETMTCISIQRMKVNDTLVVKGGPIYVYDNMESALSVLQIL